ncbi:cytochrome P450 [Pleomassaria siparia CBS 279.74]|uniref:Cytochrome P450 n=1 Tax=Pleomassaria siparia CBS 279.74 TaxID=1314801 RepID=A0A6G1KLH9_9PLEO|nr:cytochrome P450 [Pleomassaria siparia CBS 279.74]
MSVQKRVLLLASTATSFATFRYAPQLALFPRSYFWNTATLFLILYFAQLTWNLVVYPHFLSPLRHLPQPPNAHFLLGHYKPIYKNPTGEPQRAWIDTVPNDGVLYYRFLFNASRVLITTPKALAEVLVHRNYEFVKPQSLRAGLGRLLGVGILLAEGDEHKRQRKALMPAFSFRHIKDLYPIFWGKSRELTLAISAAIKEDPEKTNVVEIRDWCSRAALDIIGLAGMGQDFDAITNPNNTLNTTYRTIFSPDRNAKFLQLLSNLLPQWFLIALPMKRNDEMSSAIKTIKSVAADLIRGKRAKLEKGGESEVDILSVALESGGFTDDDLVNQLMTFLAAGHETTASAMTWAIYLLCKDLASQTRLREEIRTQLPALSDPNTQIQSTDIDRLSYLNAVLNETMRLFPPVPLTLRETVQHTTIQGHFIPKDTTVIICPWAINTSKALWGDDAQEFNPDRWMGVGKANTGGAESNFAVTTFLHGPRSCIGKDFAKAEFACLMAAFVGRFEFEMEDKNWELQIQGGITARPKGGLRIKLREVEGW